MTTGIRRTVDAARRGHRQRRLPKGFKYTGSEVAEWANDLIAEYEATVGSVTRECQETVEAAAAWQLVALYILKVLRDDSRLAEPTLSIETRVQFITDIAKATQRRRDLALSLKIDDPQRSNFAAVPSLPEDAGDSAPENAGSGRREGEANQ